MTMLIDGSNGVQFPDTTNQSTASSYTGARFQLFTASGTFTKPVGVSKVRVTVVGGGAGGSNGSGGWGGFAVAEVDISANVTVTVGAGGAGSGGGGVPGTAGGASSFGSAVSATGGTGSGSATGVDGTGTVTSGTALRIGSMKLFTDAVPYLGGSTGIKAGAAAAWSPSSIYCAGQGTSPTTSVGGVGGAVLVEW